MSEVTDYVDEVERALSKESGVFQSLCEQARDGRMKWGERASDWAPDTTGESG